MFEANSTPSSRADINMASLFRAVLVLLFIVTVIAENDLDYYMAPVNFKPFPNKHCGSGIHAWDTQKLTPGQCRTVVSMIAWQNWTPQGWGFRGFKFTYDRNTSSGATFAMCDVLTFDQAEC